MFETTMDIIFWDFLILYQTLFSPQVRSSVIISNKHGIYELPHELRNDLRLSKLGNIKISKLHKIIAWCSVNTSKKFLKNKNWTLPVGRYFTEKLRFAWNILARIVDMLKALPALSAITVCTQARNPEFIFENRKAKHCETF